MVYKSTQPGMLCHPNRIKKKGVPVLPGRPLELQLRESHATISRRSCEIIALSTFRV